MAKKTNADWRTETPEERRAFEAYQLRKRGPTGPHSMTCKLLNWWFCSRCGLVSLKNDVTRRALRAGCEL